MTAAARRAFIESFRPGGARGGPDDPTLSHAERVRRGEARRRMWYIELAQKASRARNMAADAYGLATSVSDDLAALAHSESL